MAGSYSPIGPEVPEDVHSRIEGLKLLAHHLDEPIVIFNPQMELVYANPAADLITKGCPLTCGETTTLSHSCDSQPTACEPCPATSLFQASEKASNASFSYSSTVESPAMCPLPRAVPLRSEQGATHFAVMMGMRGSESLVTRQQNIKAVQVPKEDTTRGETAIQSLIGESESIQQLVEMIQLVAASEATVLIQGESGTGKELVAKTIHALSRRQAQPFVVVECSSLPETLLESELFGHIRGAFTGAVADRKGLFEEAQGGTIFLDEIADTTPAFQARLLRVLQEGEIKPVGSSQSIKVDVRVISAGNRPLDELVKTKQFRADLYYRLAVLPLQVPSLRERQEDIPLLAAHFVYASSRRHGRSSLTVDPEALRALSKYAWPGNVRELENLIERAVVICRHTVLRTTDFFDQKDRSSLNGDLNSVSQAARQVAERDHILQTLAKTKGDKTRAARLLKISRSSLYNKLRTYQIS